MSASVEEHRFNVRQAFDRFRYFGLTINVHKCHFGQTDDCNRELYQTGNNLRTWRFQLLSQMHSSCSSEEKFRRLEMALVTDALVIAIGAVLEQTFGDISRPIGFFSRKLTKIYMNYSTYDKKMLAFYHAVKCFRHLLGARVFVIKTAHKRLVYAFFQKPERASPRQLRYLHFISQFTIEVVYLSGPENTVADALSHLNAICTGT